MRLKVLSLLVFGSIPACGFATAELTLYNPAKTSLATLAVPVGVRAIGMGEAYTAAGNDVYALNWNPAGLAQVSDFQLGLAHNEWSSELGLRQEFLTYGQGLGQNSGLGISANYFSLGHLDERDTTGALLSQSQAFALAGNFGYGWSMLEANRFKLGLAAEFGMESLFGTVNSGFGGSLGLNYDITRNFNLGLSAMHLGSGVGGFMPPSAINLGVSGLLLNRKLTLALDGALPFNANPEIKAGLEYDFGALALRGGYRYAIGALDGDVQSGPTAGIGFKMGVFNIDYAFVPYGDLATTHRVAATINLPADFFQPQINSSESSTTTAKAYYDKALGMEKNGDVILALVEYNRAKDAYPEKLRANPQQFYKTTLKKIKDLQVEMNKSGQSEQVRKMIQKKISEGQEFLRNKRYREAVLKFKETLALDETSQLAAKLLKDAQAGLEDRKRALKTDARIAYKSGKLLAAVDAYRKVQQMDDSDAEVNAFFSENEASIRDQLKKVHRQGIDLYVAGKIEDAIKKWKFGLSLDPNDPINFKRDIDKAEKLLDLRGKK